jgi:putative transposase
MPYRKEQFVNGEIYHIVIKRIADKLLFKDTDDYFRGIFSIFEFNNIHPVEIYKRRQEIQSFKKRLRETKGGPSSSKLPDVRNLLVEVLFFCFMPNHIHLVLRQLKEEGIIKFMGKIGTGYAGYFKRKYGIKDKGYFFQGRFTAVHIETDEQLKIVFVYVHTNPISLIEPQWKEIGIRSPEKVIKFLEDYKWSSYSDYIGKKNFTSVTERDFISKAMGGEEKCKEFVEGWVKYKGEIREFAELAIE